MSANGCAVTQHRLGFRGGACRRRRPGPGPAEARAAPRLALIARTRHADRGGTRLGMHRHDRDRAETRPPMRSEQHRQPVGAKDQREGAARPQQPRRGRRPRSARCRRRAANARRGGAHRARPAALRIVERRVHQHDVAACRGETGGARIPPGAPRRRARRASTRPARPLRAAFSRASAARRASISTSVTRTPGHPRRQREAGGTDPGAEVDDAVAGARRRRRREQDGVVAEAVAAARLEQAQPAAERRIVGECSRPQPASGRSSWPSPASSSSRRAAAT